MDKAPLVGAVILGAGRSQRMGAPKLALPWGNTTVIEQIVAVLKSSGVSPIVLVTGGARVEVERLLSGAGVVFVHNPNYEQTEMLESLQIGLQEMPSYVSGCLVVLGDQPQIKHETVEKLFVEFGSGEGLIVVPSYRMRRGHPWLVDKRLWEVIGAYHSPQTLRDFMRERSVDIRYAEVFSNSVLLDLDTPEDYQTQRP